MANEDRRLYSKVSFATFFEACEHCLGSGHIALPQPGHDDCSECDGGKEDVWGLTVAEGNPAPILRTTEHDLDPVLALVAVSSRTIAWPLAGRPCSWRDRPCARLGLEVGDADLSSQAGHHNTEDQGGDRDERRTRLMVADRQGISEQTGGTWRKRDSVHTPGTHGTKASDHADTVARGRSGVLAQDRCSCRWTTSSPCCWSSSTRPSPAPSSTMSAQPSTLAVSFWSSVAKSDLVTPRARDAKPGC
jgi:hypothetical protein